MNIFFLDFNPYVCAMYHCNQHCIKMILEYFQLLSTCHRILDGTLSASRSKTGRNIKRYILTDSREKYLYKSTHNFHPSCVWVRESTGNYNWLYNLVCCLCDEYTRRYSKVHASDTKLRKILGKYPKNIPMEPFTSPPLCMPDEYKSTNIIHSYRIFYNYSKIKFATWPIGEEPWWIIR